MKEPFAQLEALEKCFPDSSFLLTLGVHGSVCRTNGQTCTMGSCKLETIDTTAEGDTFAGFFLAEWMSGGTPEQFASDRPPRAPALAVTRRGTIRPYVGTGTCL